MQLYSVTIGPDTYTAATPRTLRRMVARFRPGTPLSPLTWSQLPGRIVCDQSGAEFSITTTE